MQTRAEAIQTLVELMKDIRIAMVTTVTPAGELHSRPMAVQQVEFDGDLWFFTSRDSGKVDDVARQEEVNVSFVNEGKQRYVSVSGTGELVNDREKMKELWNPIIKVWFPGGLEDPNLALFKVQVTGGEYWDGPASKLLNFIDILKSAVTGTEHKAARHETVSL